MERIKNLPPTERPREKLQFDGASSLTDQELLAILLGSGTPQVPVNSICGNLLEKHNLKSIAGMDIEMLCRFKGIGPAKATTLLAAAEFSRRVRSTAQKLSSQQACYEYLKPLLAEATQLQYILLLISSGRELLAFSEAGSVLPDVSWVTGLAMKAGAKYIMLGRNGWPAFSKAEARFLRELQSGAVSLGMHCEGLMSVGPKSCRMI
jgi:DNA repair protein RadC